MIDTTQVPVTYLEGIGPAGAEALKTIGIYMVADLLRATEQAIRNASNGTASINKARRWRAMARFVEVEGVDNQFAEALAIAGLESVEQVRFRTIAEIVDIFQQAKDSGKIQSVPNADIVHGMILDATILDLTGSLNGTVRDIDGNPIEGAAVRIGNLQWYTNAQGRFRSTRVALGQQHQLVIEHELFATVMFSDPPLVADDATISVEIFTLVKADTQPPQNGVVLEGELCEYEGDTLPPLTQSMTTKAMGDAPLRENDIFVVHKMYAGDEDVQLTSKYLRYESGRFVTLNWRVQANKLPSGFKIRDTFRFRKGTFTKIAPNPHHLRHLAAMRRLRKAMKDSANPQTPGEIDAALELRTQFLLNEL